jgi:hypothetical protein
VFFPSFSELLKADLETSTDQISKILDLVWIRENVPSDWRKGLIIKLAKKGDLTCCGNWRGITLIPNIAKIMGKIRSMISIVSHNLP